MYLCDIVDRPAHSELNYQSLVLFKWERGKKEANSNADIKTVRRHKAKPIAFLSPLHILSFFSKLLPGKILGPNVGSSPQLTLASGWFLELLLSLMDLWGSPQPQCSSDDGANPSRSFQRDLCFLLLEVENVQNEEIWVAAGRRIPNMKISQGGIWIWPRSNNTAECNKQLTHREHCQWAILVLYTLLWSECLCPLRLYMLKS